MKITIDETKFDVKFSRDELPDQIKTNSVTSMLKEWTILSQQYKIEQIRKEKIKIRLDKLNEIISKSNDNTKL